ncbi:prolipoprotein diacylglyceryl transferase [Candidatus Saccharibacteria bacterium]|nr:prolipoprotein diacylglyceryl transferase [Candidatus Saccharibacteria bacterium]
MLPVITIFGHDFSMYAICACVGILLALFVAMKTAKRLKVDDNNVLILGLVSAIGIFLGGHILYALTNFHLIIEFFQKIDQVNSFGLFLNCFLIIFGGQVFYGGLIGGLIAGYIYLKKTKKDVALYAYIAAPSIPLFHAFGRIGCFLGGCCYGVEWEHGITYHNDPIEIANGTPRLPIQLIEAGCNFALFGVLYYLQRKGKCKNSLIFIYLAAYSIIRFIDEFFRGDAYRGFIGPLSTSQFISILIFIFAICGIIRLWIKNGKSVARPSASSSQKS